MDPISRSEATLPKSEWRNPNTCTLMYLWDSCYRAAAGCQRGPAASTVWNICILLSQQKKLEKNPNPRCVLTDVQINIKRCLSDGCDTRIHGLRAVGYQRVKKVGVSVGDASAIWYWSLLTSLVTASMETNPAFVHTILQNTQ